MKGLLENLSEDIHASTQEIEHIESYVLENGGRGGY